MCIAEPVHPAGVPRNVRLDDLLPDHSPTDVVHAEQGWDAGYHPLEQGFRYFKQIIGERIANVTVSPSGARTGTLLTGASTPVQDVRALTDREIDAVILGALLAVAT